MANIVSKDFWEQDYLGDVALPSRPDPAMAFERCLAAALERRAPLRAGESVIEIGCAPAKWLVHYAERFGARVEGIEYTAHGAALSRANLERSGVEGSVVEADFFAVEPRPFDLVLSLGFIEHFSDLEAAFAHHAAFVAPGGRLAIGVPNYRGLNRLLQRWADPAHLALHNLAAMDPGLYARLAPAHGLLLERSEYVGGFDPIIFKLGRPWVTPLFLAEGRYRRLRVADRINHRLASSYLLTVLRRP